MFSSAIWSWGMLSRNFTERVSWNAFMSDERYCVVRVDCRNSLQIFLWVLSYTHCLTEGAEGVAVCGDDDTFAWLDHWEDAFLIVWEHSLQSYLFVGRALSFIRRYVTLVFAACCWKKVSRYVTAPHISPQDSLPWWQRPLGLIGTLGHCRGSELNAHQHRVVGHRTIFA